jgi:hypothetical protein
MAHPVRVCVGVRVCAGVRVCGSSMVRTLEQGEGAVLAIAHFNTDSASLLVYGTQRGAWRLLGSYAPMLGV